MMINDTIQELFEGSLADEQSAELFHVLSVSPERRVDFNAYMALMAAMQRDRAANALTSDEDSEIWGILGGLGAATITTSAGSAIWSWLAKGAAVIAVGVIGYILGTTFTSNKTVTGGNSIVTSGSKTVTQATPPSVTPNAGTPTNARSSAGTPANGTSSAGSRAPGAISGPAVTSPAPIASATSSSRIATPKVLYRDRIVYRDSAPITSAADAAARRSLFAGNTSSRSSSSMNGGNSGKQSNGNGGDGTTANTTQPATQNSANGNTPAHSTAIDSTNLKTSASASPIKPEDAMANMSERNIPSPQMMTTALRRNGIEIGLNERTGAQILRAKGDEAAPIFSTHHLNISYHFGEGRFGLGARLGYGTFPVMTLSSSITFRKNTDGNIKIAETLYSAHPQLRTQAFTEFFTNYRIPFGNSLALCAEAAYGTSTSITKAGGDISLLWFLTERVGVQMGGGISHYWYSLDDDVTLKLNAASNGTSFADNVKAGAGTIFELRYGMLFHF
ncbi:MAG: hypothetical protein JWQ98_2988 [Chlorobi bacterium]|nr:hypothetical protein [Chlorobiota bacterium]